LSLWITLADMNAPLSCTANAADRRLGELDATRGAPAEGGATASEIRPKRGAPDEKIWSNIISLFGACSRLKYHKTAKTFFGKAWRETA